jgi:DNA gyrase subunit A
MTAPNQRERILPRLIEDEMKDSFIDYSMSVIVQRALPDVRDGLKPVHRRILYAMAVYDSLVRMVQDFSLRYPLVDGQGNFGSIDGDSAAAYRYTEARLTQLAVAMLDDIEKNTVAWVPNFDDRLEEPTVLPSRLPNLLINGSSGIAVGMATNIPPHNIMEVAAAAKHLIDEPDCDVAALRQHVTGPDFPTGGFIYGRDGVNDCYETGRGRIVMRARAFVEETKAGRERIVITEIPFQVNKSRLIEQIAELVRRKKVTDISDMRDESDRDGMRVVIELKRDANPKVVLNQLYKHTQMQTTFGAIMLALVDGQPQVLDLKQLLRHFIDHRHQVITRRTEYDLGQAEAREHILEGLKIAVDAIDEVVKIIRKAKDVASADAALRKRFELSEKQSEAILNMRLARLTALEIDKLEAELEELRKLIKKLKAILASKKKRLGILKDELDEMVKKFGDDRRTEIVAEEGDFSVEDLIADEDMVVTISHAGYIKRIPVTTYRQQRRGGRGLNGMGTKEDDWVEHLFIASTHDYVLFFTDTGQVYWLKVYDIPQGGRAARGKPVVNLLQIKSEERIAAFVGVRKFSDDQYLIFATAKGLVKKTVLSSYGNPRANGINAINVEKGDELIEVMLTDGTNDIVLATSHGMSIRFSEKDAREMGRATTGVRGIQLAKDDRVIGMVVVRREATLLVVAEKGLGKRSPLGDYRVQKRGGKGIITLKRSERTGSVVALKEVLPQDELMVVTRHGVIIRVPVEGIRVIGRNTQGVKVMNLDGGDTVIDVARVVLDDEETLPEEPAAQVVAQGRNQREMKL